VNFKAGPGREPGRLKFVGVKNKVKNKPLVSDDGGVEVYGRRRTNTLDSRYL